MDDLDRFILEAELKDGWRATVIHEIQRDQPNRCRAYAPSVRVFSGAHIVVFIVATSIFAPCGDHPRNRTLIVKP
jgi:hypothetical protein